LRPAFRRKTRQLAVAGPERCRIPGGPGAIEGRTGPRILIAEFKAQFDAPTGIPDMLSRLLGLLWIILTLLGIYWIHRATVDLLPQVEDRSVMIALSRNWALIAACVFPLTWVIFTGGALVSGSVDASAAKIFITNLIFLGFLVAYRVLVHYLRVQNLDETIKIAIGNAARAVVRCRPGSRSVGLAIGFGAQTLVKDVVSGVFFLIDDAFRRGEYVDLKRFAFCLRHPASRNALKSLISGSVT
jgi:small-conductance mechanosensitive channel